MLLVNEQYLASSKTQMFQEAHKYIKLRILCIIGRIILDVFFCNSTILIGTKMTYNISKISKY